MRNSDLEDKEDLQGNKETIVVCRGSRTSAGGVLVLQRRGSSKGVERSHSTLITNHFSSTARQRSKAFLLSPAGQTGSKRAIRT
jgi:rhodanese-related sulfurtransferase